VPARRRGIGRFGRAATAIPAILAAVCLVGQRTPILAPPGPTIPGVDVSHYQRTIDWPAVFADGYRFAYIKASEGRGLPDPTYRRNVREARAAGLAVGAYHFARPDGSAGDALVEANAFLRLARPASGNLAPMLDLETSGPLDPADLQTWVRAWLGHVAAATGVRPIIYAGSTFWRAHMADTLSLATYPLMWAAAQPGSTIPAKGWASLGWTGWQWSTCGTVDGVDGCVDLDVLRRDQVRLLRIP
jgi:GH25 family lysozyme M1 (1,4-beta-N-acetylmuramidase)